MSTALHVLTFLQPIEPYLTDPMVSEVMINEGGNRVFIERRGLLEELPVRLEAGDVEAAIIQIGNEIGQRVDQDHPIVEAMFDNGDRASGVLESVSVGGSTLTIRRFGQRFSLDALVAIGTLTHAQVATLQSAVKRHLNILISGATGSGKTTLLMALLDEIPLTRRIILIESTAEITLGRESAVHPADRPHLVKFQARTGRQGRGEGRDVDPVTMTDLVKNVLRHRPDMVILGEVRGDEAADLLTVLNSGHRGSLSTIHADSAPLALRKLAELAAGRHLPIEVTSVNVKDAIHLVVQINRLEDGRRQVTDLYEVPGLHV